MKALVVYYSHTGNTRKIGNAIAKEIGAEVEEIKEQKARKGFFGFITAGMSAARRKETKIEKVTKKPIDYDLLIIGTPIWAWAVTPAVRTYLKHNKVSEVAFFCTQASSGAEQAFKEMERLSKKPKCVLAINEKEMKSYQDKLKNFCSELKSS